MSGERTQNMRKLQNHLNQQNSWTNNGMMHEQNLKKTLKSRSRKQNISEESLSFEKQLVKGHWKDFLKSYQKCFHSSRSKYQQHLETNKKNQPSKSQKQHILFQQIRINHFFSELDIQQFTLDLEKENKLVDFLFLIETHIQPSIAKELTFIAFQVWQLYVGFKSDVLEEQEFFNFSQKVSEKFFATTFEQLGIKALPGSAGTCEQLKQFIVNFCIRILAIIEGYFTQSSGQCNENPQ